MEVSEEETLSAEESEETPVEDWLVDSAEEELVGTLEWELLEDGVGAIPPQEVRKAKAAKSKKRFGWGFFIRPIIVQSFILSNNQNRLYEFVFS